MSGPRNKFETKLWGQIVKTGRAEYETEKLDYILECDYVPDFILKSKKTPGKKIYIEGKGEFDAAARRKMVAVKKKHPTLDIRFVFYNAYAKLRRGSQTTCAQWAVKNGFPFAHKDIPKAWILE